MNEEEAKRIIEILEEINYNLMIMALVEAYKITLNDGLKDKIVSKIWEKYVV